jgi:hypothetical protein
MRNAMSLVGAVAVAATMASAAQAGAPRPAIPAELGTRSPLGDAWIPYECIEGPVTNFYHNAYYGHRAPAIYLGYAYRPYHRYTANQIVPRTYFCSGT